MSFPNLKLLDLLSSLDSPRPFSAILPSKELRSLYLEALTFLLRHNLVVQLHTYVCKHMLLPVNLNVDVNIPKEIRIMAKGPNIDVDDFTIEDPSRLSDLESKCIEFICEAVGSPLNPLFKRYDALEFH